MQSPENPAPTEDDCESPCPTEDVPHDDWLCSDCKRIPVRALYEQAISKGDRHGKNIGYSGYISVKNDCALCNLVTEALSLAVQDFDTEHDPPRRSSSKKVKLESDHCSGPYLLITGNEEAEGPISARIRLRTTDHSNTLCQNGEESEYRPLVKSGINFDIVRQWLEEAERLEKDNLTEPIGLILIDVKEKKLVEMTSSTRYIALSYVWGQTKGLETTIENYGELQTENSISIGDVNIPLVIRDAIEMVSRLQERYLWVDRLCLIQNSDTKHEKIEQMGRVYEHALLTIFAISGKDANHGLPGVSPGSRPAQMTRTIQGVQCSPELSGLNLALENSRHFTRGWTFQEHLLSRRRLFVGNHQVYFQSSEGVLREDDPNTKIYWSDLVLHDLDALRCEEQFGKAYSRLVESYTKRQLTFDDDILRAFAGAIEAVTRFSEIQDKRFVTGLSIQNFFYEILWMPAGKPVRRRFGTADLPSWSWAGWKCPVRYDLLYDWTFLNENDDLIVNLHSVELMLPTEEILTLELPKSRSLHDDCSIKVYRKQTHTTARDINSAQRPPGLNNLTILQFWAYVASTPCNISIGAKTHARSSFAPTHYAILDPLARKCGALFSKRLSGVKKVFFDCLWVMLSSINISRCYFDNGSEDMSKYTRHIRSQNFFDAEYFDSPTWCGCMPFVMLIRPHGDIWERVAIATIHPEAWDEFQPEWKHILLE